MHLNLLDIWNDMGWPVRSVVIVLTLQALATITSTIDRLIFLWRAKRKDRAFGVAVGSKLERGQLRDTLIESARHSGSPLAELVRRSLGAYEASRAADASIEDALKHAERAAERETELFAERLARGLNVIASTGSTAPFVGLLGTVLGIIGAFRLISANGSGGIGTIGAAIGEALVVTGYGLVVAIPAVLAFNAISVRLDGYEAKIRRRIEELRDRISVERWEVEPASAAPAKPASGQKKAA